MRRLTVEHKTHYRYAEPVSFGQHRLMLRPRDSHGLRLLDSTLTLFPIAEVTYVYDVFGNSIALLDFQESADELRIDSVLELEIYPVPPLEGLISPDAATYPFVYSSDDRLDISLISTRHYTDSGAVEAFARSFLPASGHLPTLDLLMAINQAIKDRLAYKARYEEGTQSPAETLSLGSGTCRDFALLFMETVRELGFAARFVTGYLYTPQLDPLAEGDFLGAGATHAWATVYLPGAGWIDFDPTNALVGTEHLVRVAVVRDPRQAIPVSGSFHGSAGAFLGMDVEVLVSSHGVRPSVPVRSTPPAEAAAPARPAKAVPAVAAAPPEAAPPEAGAQEPQPSDDAPPVEALPVEAPPAAEAPITVPAEVAELLEGESLAQPPSGPASALDEVEAVAPAAAPPAEATPLPPA
ncbi:transglutaminase N-terminal domain-containing protein [Azorhizobium doebereinerae]|uniref:transglutaminase N-terminal domain-containing protein n=1 Tax=Azorhizobium doebereinerae TaxID=281091 RepID=UPI00041755BB